MSSLTFLEPSRLFAIAGVAALAAAYVVLQRRRRRYAVRFTNLDLLDSIAPARPGWRRHLPASAVAIAMIAMVVSLARPMHDVRIPKETAVVMLAIDVSASMSATDVEPTRLQAAVAAASAFVEELPAGFEVGLVAFDGTARLLRAPTIDHAAVVSSLARLQVGPGTATGEGILTALDAIEQVQTDGGTIPAAVTTPADGEAPSATIVLLSDGATTVGTALAEAETAAVDAGVPVSTITFGTATGTVLVQGRTVPVPPDTASMAEVASKTGGTAFEAASGKELARVYDDIQARVGYSTEQRELTTWFVAAGVLMLLAAVVASLVWTGRFL
jgi:Ca-activated chloride channel family protein